MLSKKSKSNNFASSVLSAVSLVLIAATTYVAIDLWVSSQPSTVDTSKVTTENWQESEGRDETEPTPQTLSEHKVAPDEPRMLKIAKLGINARVLSMGVNLDNTIQAPINIYDSGWYKDSAKPGQSGAVFINAHASGPTREGLFAYLDTLQVGDEVEIEKGDGSTVRYRVVHNETIDLKKVDMGKVLSTYNGAEKGLNLMTCNGSWLQDSRTYDHRTMIYTEQV